MIERDRICGMNIHYVRHSLGRFLDDMDRLGISRIELWAGMPHLCVDDAGDSTVTSLHREFRMRGARLTCITPEQCVYPINLASEVAATRERSIRYFMRCLEICDALEAPHLLVTPGWDYVGADRSPGWSRSRDALGSIADRAAEFGVELLLEPLSETETNLITTASDLVRMIDEIGSPSVAAILDMNAMASAGDTVLDYVNSFGNRLRHVHVCDGTPEGHLAWGDGILPLGEYVKVLESAGFRGTYSFEFTNQSYWLDPLPPLTRSIDAFLAATADPEERSN